MILSVVVILFGPRTAWGQDVPRVSVHLDADTVGVGDVVHLSLDVQSTQGPPRDPDPGKLGGVVLVDRSMSPSTSISVFNGSRSVTSGLSAIWALEARREGVHTLGPVTFLIGSRRFSTETLRLRVVAAGHAPPPSRAPPGGGPGNMASPFDLWKNLFGNDPFDRGGGGDPFAEPAIPTDPRLALEASRGEWAFLHATVDKGRVVVGEQVTLSVFLYVDVEARSLEFRDAHEAPLGDFVKRPILEDDAKQKSIGLAQVGNRIFDVRLVRKSALFPLKSGALEIGAMTLTMTGRGGGLMNRESERLPVRVDEPPMAGRPPGYTVGDVGRFALSATVSPRDLEAGGALAVTVELSGTGNLPSVLPLPEGRDFEWLDPDVRDDLKASGDRWGGKRTFTYVVRPRRAGALSLGQLRLPFYDADARAYSEAKVDLGTVTVKENPAAPAASASASAETADPLSTLPAPRPALHGASPPRGRHLADTPPFWGGLVAPSALYGLLLAASVAVRRVRQVAARRDRSEAAEAKARTLAAEAACRGEDPRAADGAVARAIEGAVKLHVGANLRGIPVDEVARTLESEGVDGATARGLQGILEACGNARFSPDADDMVAVRQRWQSAKEHLQALETRRRGRPS